MFKQKPDGCLRVLAVGDVIGRPGRKFLKKALPTLKAATSFDALVVNVENAAGGFGLTLEVYRELEHMGIDCMTSGNHIYDKKGYEDWMPWAPSLLRPENFPPDSPGKGFSLFDVAGVKLGIVNLIGRTFMKPYGCPFRDADRVLTELRRETPLILVDFHGEATSEKGAMGWYLCGRASAVWGTHTHVPTADGRILDGFTGFQTDIGMTGPYDSVIGMKKEPVIEGFLSLNRTRFEVAKNDCRLGGCLLDLEKESGRCVALQGLFLSGEELAQIEQTGARAGYP